MNEAIESIHADANQSPALPRLVKFSDGQTAQLSEVLPYASHNCTLCYGRGIISVVPPGRPSDKPQTEICRCASRRFLKSKQTLAQTAEPSTVVKPKESEKKHQSDLLRIERLSREVTKLETELAARERHFNGKQATTREEASSAEQTKKLCENESILIRAQIQVTQAQIEETTTQLQELHTRYHNLSQEAGEIVEKDRQAKAVLGEVTSKLEVATNRFGKDTAGLLKDIERARRRLATAQAYQSGPTP